MPAKRNKPSKRTPTKQRAPRKPKQLSLEAPLPEPEAVAQVLSAPARSWTKGDVLVDGYTDRWVVEKVGLVPGEMLEPRFFAELRSCAGSHVGTIRVEYPCVGGVMASSSYAVEPKAGP